jgi:death on curing protein
VPFEFPTYDHIVLLNRKIIDRYGGLRHHVLNGGALSSALSNIEHGVYGQNPFPNLEDKASKLAFAIATGHVFSDGNKKTAVSALDLMLELNGQTLSASEIDLIETMYKLARHELAFEDFVDWVRPRVVS